MPSDIHNRLMRAKERLRTKQKLAAMLREAQTLLQDEQQKRERHALVLASERSDVDRLEGFGLTALFYAILGTKEDRLSKERQEYLAARLKHEEHTQAVEEAGREVERLQNEVVAYASAEADYERVLADKEQLLTQAGDHRTEALLNLSGQQADLESERKELLEAIQAGEAAQGSLENVRTSLQSAESWGTWDMLGGGALVTMAKHSEIDSARADAHTAQEHLRLFQEELADADERLHVSLGEIGGFSTFADYFFDGLIADWMVQSQVQNALEACEPVLSQVAEALSACQQRLAKTEQELQRAETQRRGLIEQA